MNIEDIKTKHREFVEKGVFKGGHNSFGLFLQQIDYEWESFINIVSGLKIQYGLEIGTYGGGTWYTLCSLSNDDATLISLDLHEGHFKDVEMKQKSLREMGKVEQNIHLFNSDSQTNESLKNVKDILGGNKLDFLFIDGDHSYNGVKTDFTMYSPLVKENGIIAFHDIQPHVKGAEVDILWNQIKNNFSNYIEIIEDKEKQEWAGIGIIIK